ncbi:MAG: KpsF/GutQ family sugar-phosphate isomerase [Candidatus Eiseniibacteriota bacterium]|jgi:arabinose-5-phosphate isomerase
MSEATGEEFTLERLRGLPPHAIARTVAEREAGAVVALGERFGASFDRAVELLLDIEGRLIVVGVGKSGQVAAKVASTLTSTGTPSFFVHPADAMHGDLGLIRSGDAALVFSNSGATAEICRLLPLLGRLDIPVIAVTARADSELGSGASVVIETGHAPEASPWGLVPTSSTTVSMVVGDALAVALLVRRGFAAEDFAFLHPGGVIGRSASTRVGEIAHRGSALPRVAVGTTLRDALGEIVSKRLGMTTIVDAQGRLAGVITDGDLKRILLENDAPLDRAVESFMSRSPRTIGGQALVAEAVRRMEENLPGPITSLIVVDGEKRPTGVIHLHDCLRVP